MPTQYAAEAGAEDWAAIIPAANRLATRTVLRILFIHWSFCWTVRGAGMVPFRSSVTDKTSRLSTGGVTRRMSRLPFISVTDESLQVGRAQTVRHSKASSGRHGRIVTGAVLNGSSRRGVRNGSSQQSEQTG